MWNKIINSTGKNWSHAPMYRYVFASSDKQAYKPYIFLTLCKTFSVSSYSVDLPYLLSDLPMHLLWNGTPIVSRTLLSYDFWINPGWNLTISFFWNRFQPLLLKFSLFHGRFSSLEMIEEPTTEWWIRLLHFPCYHYRAVWYNDLAFAHFTLSGLRLDWSWIEHRKKNHFYCWLTWYLADKASSLPVYINVVGCHLQSYPLTVYYWGHIWDGWVI